jgi:hypothetical protein
MTIREYNETDLVALQAIHSQSGLPKNCMPNPRDPLMVVKLVAQDQSKRAVMSGFVKLTGEAYIQVDHNHGTAVSRLDLMEELVIHGLHAAAQPRMVKCEHCERLTAEAGLGEVTAWLPPSIERAFVPRLRALSFERSPWQSYTALLK